MSDRSGSETRRRTVQVQVRLFPADHARIAALAKTRGVSKASLLRDALLKACAQ